VDSKDLWGDFEPPSVDPETALPKELRAFVVLKDPRMTVVPHFFSDEECDHLLDLVEGCWMPSLVGQATNSSEEDYSVGNLENALSTTRTSWSCMLRYAQTHVVERLEHRLASMAGLPLENLERMNMVRYAPGELFDEHHDGKFRPITIFVYLNDLQEGDTAGDTFFPVLGVSFRPRRGTAVVWSNVDGDKEDSRMLHAGRAPTKGVKYGVNCFFNVKEMRHMTVTGQDINPEDAVTIKVGDLRKDGAEDSPPRVVAFRLCPDPKVVAVPAFLSATEVEELLKLSGAEALAAAAGFSGNRPWQEENVLRRDATCTLRLFQPGETPVVESVEARLAATAGLGLDYLAMLRVVRVSGRVGSANRGCGPKSVYICLSERDEVFFVRLGMRFVLRRGDALLWPNVDWATGQAVEDVRTLRVHLPQGGANSDGAPVAVGLDAFFHDGPVREQQRLRNFVPDGPDVVAQGKAVAAQLTAQPLPEEVGTTSTHE